MDFKRFSILLILLIIFAFISSFFLGTSTPSKKVQLSLIPSNIPTENDIISALRRVIEGKEEIRVKLLGNDTCFWIKPTHNGTHYLFQISEYKAPGNNCLGFAEKTEYLLRKRGFVVFGDTCVCGGKTYSIKWEKNGVRIAGR